MKVKLLLFFVLVQYTLFAQNIVGSWKGDLEIGGTKLPLVLHIARSGNEYTSTLDSPNQGANGLKVDTTRWENGTLTVIQNPLGVRYTARWQDGKWVGTFVQMGNQASLTLLPYTKENKSEKEVNPLGKLPGNIADRLVKVEDFINYLEKENIAAGGLSIFKNGKEVYKRNFGQKNLPDYNPKAHLLQIGSITKTMTSVMMQQLDAERKLSLSDPLSKYFLNMPNGDSVTLLQMLNHSSGLSDYVENDKGSMWLRRKASEAEILNLIRAQGSVFKPGTSVKYSNSGYYLLTKILEKESGASFADNLKKRILKPLGMKNTFSATTKPKNVLASYIKTKNWEKVKDFEFTNVIGVGDIAADPTDLSLFINGLFQEKLLSKNQLQKMLPQKDQKFGIGIAKVPFQNKIFIGHSGSTYGTNSLMIHNPEDALTLSYSINAANMGPLQFVKGVLNALYDAPFEYPQVSHVQIPENELQQYTGNYTSEQPPLGMKIFVKDGVLYGQGTNQPHFPLNYTEKNMFQYEPAGVKTKFDAAKGEMILYQNGGQFLFKRIKK